MNEITEQQTQQPVSMELNPIAVADLVITAKWAKFIAIVTFIFTGLMIFFGIALGSIMSNFSDFYGGAYYGSASGFMSSFYVIIMVLAAALYFFMGYFLILFASRTANGIRSNDSQLLAGGIRSLKNFSIYCGVLMIISLALMVVGVLGVFSAMSMMGAML